MARQIVLDASVLGVWPLRGLLLGLGDREAAVISPRWSPGALAEMRDDLARAVGARQAEELAAAMAACYPEAEVEGAADHPDLDLLDRRDAEVAAAAMSAGALVVATLQPGRLPPADVARLGIAALHPDDLLLELHANDPWKVLHSTIAYADALRGPRRRVADVIDLLGRHVPAFAEVIRAQVAGLSANQPRTVFAATHGQRPLPGDGGGPWWCIACDPIPCPGHDDGARIELLGTNAACLPADECAFVAVTKTARHFTLVWPAPDDPALLEAASAMKLAHLHPQVVAYGAGRGPAVSYWQWVETAR